MSKVTVKAECEACNGTGLYQGMCEPKATAVVCVRCNGTGCATFTYIPFKKRKGKKGVQLVRRSRGSLIALGVGPVGPTITYDEFAAGKMP